MVFLPFKENQIGASLVGGKMKLSKHTIGIIIYIYIRQMPLNRK